MNKYIGVALFFFSCIGVAVAQSGPELAKQKNCLSCHAVDQRLVGPAFKEVAAKYKGNSDAPAVLAKKVREGGSGVWGQLTMPANPQVNETQAVELVKWVLAQ